jgi:hypothetical protein
MKSGLPAEVIQWAVEPDLSIQVVAVLGMDT